MVDRATGVDAEGRRSQRATPAPESAPRLELLTNFPPLPLFPSPSRFTRKIKSKKGRDLLALRGVVSLSFRLHIFLVALQLCISSSSGIKRRIRWLLSKRSSICIRGKIAPFLIGREWRLYEYVTRGNLEIGWDLIRSKVKFSFENCLLIQIYIPEIERFRD